MDFLGFNLKTIGIMVVSGVITGIIVSAAISYTSGLYIQQAKLAAKAEVQRLVLAAAQQTQNSPTTEASTPVPTQQAFI